MTSLSPESSGDNYRSCVGIALVNKEGKIFIGQRCDKNKPAWQMPQGGIEKDEDPKDAALRELAEETGITSDKVELIAITDGWLYYDYPPDAVNLRHYRKHKGQKQKWALVLFKGDDSDVDLNAFEPEFSAWTWASPRDVVDLIVAFKKPVYEQALKELHLI